MARYQVDADTAEQNRNQAWRSLMLTTGAIDRFFGVPMTQGEQAAYTPQQTTGVPPATAPTPTPAPGPAPTNANPEYGWNDRGAGALPTLPPPNANASTIASYGDRAIAGASIPSTEEMQAAEEKRNAAQQQARVDAQSRTLLSMGLTPEEINQRGIPGLNASNYHPAAGGPAVELDYGPNQRIFGSGVGTRGQPNNFVGAGLPALGGVGGSSNASMTDVITGQLEGIKGRIAALTGSGNFRDIRTRLQLEKQQDKLIAQLQAHGQIEHARAQLGEITQTRLQTGRQNAAHIAFGVPGYIDALTAARMLNPEQRAIFERVRRGGAQYTNVPTSPLGSMVFNNITGQWEPGMPGYGGYGVPGYGQ